MLESSATDILLCSSTAAFFFAASRCSPVLLLKFDVEEAFWGGMVSLAGCDLVEVKFDSIKTKTNIKKLTP